MVLKYSWLKRQSTTTTVLWFSEFSPGQPGWANTRRNIHPLTLILVINHPLSASSICYNPWHPPCSIYVLTVILHNLCTSFFWSNSWSGTLHFILHTFLHPIIVFFSVLKTKAHLWTHMLHNSRGGDHEIGDLMTYLAIALQCQICTKYNVSPVIKHQSTFSMKYNSVWN